MLLLALLPGCPKPLPDLDDAQRDLSGSLARGGGPIDSPDEVGGQPVTGAEQALTLPEDPMGDADGDGYTDLEEWLHDLG